MTTAAYFCLMLLVLRPGYWINDDVKIIWNMIGYPGNGDPIPFMIHCNVLIGLVLARLYDLHTSANWYALLLTIVNAFSIWAFLGLITATRRPFAVLLSTIIILAGMAPLMLNITYTTTAFLASLAGLCLVGTSAFGCLPNWKGLSFGGVALILTGSLLRLPMLLMALLIALPAFIIHASAIRRRRLLLVSVAAASIIVLAFVGDRLFVRASPDWNAFYAYNRVRQQVHDSHRLNNVHGQIRRIGWSPNDQELFARWFYPDERLYSLENLQYLVAKVPPASQDPGGSIGGFLRTLALRQFVPYTLWMVAVALWMMASKTSGRVSWAIVSISATVIVLNACLAIFYKDPSYILASTLAGSVIVGMLVLCQAPHDGDSPASQVAIRAGWRRGLQAAAFALLGISAVVSVGNCLHSSEINVAKQAAYGQIGAELEELREDGTVADQALIVSPAHGLPYEWSFPFTLDLPSPAYFDTGWITFSPSYYRILRDFGIESLPDALVQRDDVFLMVESGFTSYLARYYEEHFALRVRFQAIYAMPNTPQLAGYDGIFLYRVTPAE